MLLSAITTAQWYVYGKRHFTKTGYIRHMKKYLDPVQKSASIGINEEGSDGVTTLQDKVVVITGANQGIGKEVATYAAAKGSRVYMLCRSKERAEKARMDILKSTKLIGTKNEDKIKIILVDVSELKQVQNAVKEIQDNENKVDCLVCNAGALLNDKKLNSNGMEVTFTSHLLGGTYLLTKLLMPQLQNASVATPDNDSNNNNDDDCSRVIFVTSGGMYLSKFPSWDVATSSTKTTSSEEEEEDKESSDSDKDDNVIKYDGNFVYSYAKRGQVLLAEEWSKEYNSNNVKFVTVHPGWTSTSAVDDAFGDSASYLKPLRTTWEGAEGITWLMSTKSSNIESGEFYLDRTKQRKHLSGLFMSEGSYTKNTNNEINVMMKNLEITCDDVLLN